jgi:(1->4)-alpha-D-glucan 1-alpha-D-glucosylmutase
LKLTSPGVPDFYRGTELQDLSLADPDNRRPVDFGACVEGLSAVKQARPTDLLDDCSAARLKMYITWKLLNFRRAHPDLFLHGEYVPLRVSGRRANHVIAFARRLHDQWSVTAVSRLVARLTKTGAPPIGEKVWRDTVIELPADAPLEWKDVLTGQELGSPLSASNLFSTLPVATIGNVVRSCF